MAGRPRVPGERHNRGILNPEDVRNRTVRAIVGAVSTHDGFVALNFDGLPSNGRHASIPWLWASFPEAGKAAWGRYMPFQNDTLKISFDYDETPHAVGYETRAGMAGVADGRAGYPAIAKAAESDYILRFTELKSGEFDFMSVGGAYMFGAETGELLLAGGQVSLDLVRTEDRLYGQAGSYYLRNGTAHIRFGQVKRFDPTQFGDSATGPWNPALNGREFEVDVRYNDGAIDHQVARFGLGNLATDLAIELAWTGSPKLAALDLYDPTGFVKIWSFEVDNTGSARISSAQATKFGIEIPAATLSIGANVIDIVTIGDLTKTIGGQFDLTSAGDLSISAMSAMDIAVAQALSIRVLDTITIESSKSLDITAALDIAFKANSMAIMCPVALGPTPTGYVFNGTVFDSAMQSAFNSLDTVMTIAVASTADSNPTTNNIVNSFLVGLQSFLQAFKVAVGSSISTQVQVA